MKKIKQKNTVITISGKELFKNSSGKLGKHMPLVQTGTGKHKDKKAYNRKHNNRVIREEFDKNYSKTNDFILFLI